MLSNEREDSKVESKAASYLGGKAGIDCLLAMSSMVVLLKCTAC